MKQFQTFCQFLVLCSVIQITETYDFNLINDPSTNEFMSFKKPFLFEQVVNDKTNLSIILEDEGIATISWNLINRNIKSYIKIYMKFPHNPTYLDVLVETVEIPKGQDLIKYKFDYKAMYVVKLFKRIQHSNGLYINMISQDFYHNKGKDLAIAFNKENCLGASLAWPALPNVKSHQLVVWHYSKPHTGHKYTQLNITLPVTQTNHSLNLTLPDSYNVEVVYNFAHTNKTLRLKAKVPVGLETCATFRHGIVERDAFLDFWCSVRQGERGCTRRIFLYYAYNYKQKYDLDYDNDKNCFTNITKNTFFVEDASEAQEKIPKVMKAGCIDVEKTLNLTSSSIKEAIHYMIPNN